MKTWDPINTLQNQHFHSRSIFSLFCLLFLLILFDMSSKFYFYLNFVHAKEKNIRYEKTSNVDVEKLFPSIRPLEAGCLTRDSCTFQRLRTDYKNTTGDCFKHPSTCQRKNWTSESCHFHCDKHARYHKQTWDLWSDWQDKWLMDTKFQGKIAIDQGQSIQDQGIVLITSDIQPL